jgi:exosortase D (VPLPA-CTERM-specific)
MMSLRPQAITNTNATRAWIVGSVTALLAVIVFRQALIELVWRWNQQEEYSHGYIVPLVTAWLLWVRRDVLAANTGSPTWIGFVLVALAAFVHAIGLLSTISILSQLAFLIALLGITLAVGGFSLLRVSFAPVLFLIFAIPLPYFINAGLTLELQLISSRLGVAFINLFNVPVYLEGNLIDLGTYKLQVVEACSGLRYLFPLMSLSFLAAYLFEAPIWQRALVLFSSIPITIAMNGFRIGVAGVTVNQWGPVMAEGMLHFFEGWIIFLASALLLLSEIYLLARLSGRPFFDCFGTGMQAAASLPPRVVARSIDRTPLYACFATVLATLVTGTLVANRVDVIPERSRFVTFPAEIGQWRGHTSLLEPEIERGLHLDDYILSDYSSPGGQVVNLYVAYYASQQGGKYHSPLVCIPGDGWSMIAFERTNYGTNRPVNRMIIERNGQRQLVYYWYQERGRMIASEYWSRWYLIYDAVTMNRSDGALVRLVTPILPNESEKDADSRLRLFTHDLEPNLKGFVPSRNEARTTLAVSPPNSKNQ